MESPPETPTTKYLIKELFRKRIVCGNDIRKLEIKLLDQYKAILKRKDRNLNDTFAEQRAKAFVDRIYRQQNINGIMASKYAKNGEVRNPSLLGVLKARARAAVSRNNRESHAAARNTTVRAPAPAPVARNNSPSGNEGNSVPLLPKSNTSKSATRTSVLNRLKGIFKKNNTRKTNAGRKEVRYNNSEFNEFPPISPVEASKNPSAILKKANMNQFGPRENLSKFNLPPAAAPAAVNSGKVDLLQFPKAAAAPAAAPAAVNSGNEVDLLQFPKAATEPAAKAAETGVNPFAKNPNISKRAAQPVNRSLAAVIPFAGGARRRTKRGSRK